MTATEVNPQTANDWFSEAFAPHVTGLNISIESIGANGVQLRLPYSDDLSRFGGIVCGQAMMTLIDTCMVFVCYGVLNKYADVTTVSQSSQFLRPVSGRDIIAKGEATKVGRQLIFGEVKLYGEGDDRIVCTGASTFAVLPPRN